MTKEEALEILQVACQFIDCPKCYRSPTWYNTLPESERYVGNLHISRPAQKPTEHRDDCPIGKAMLVK